VVVARAPDRPAPPPRFVLLVRARDARSNQSSKRFASRRSAGSPDSPLRSACFAPPPSLESVVHFVRDRSPGPARAVPLPRGTVSFHPRGSSPPRRFPPTYPRRGVAPGSGPGVRDVLGPSPPLDDDDSSPPPRFRPSEGLLPLASRECVTEPCPKAPLVHRAPLPSCRCAVALDFRALLRPTIRLRPPLSRVTTRARSSHGFCFVCGPPATGRPVRVEPEGSRRTAGPKASLCSLSTAPEGTRSNEQAAPPPARRSSTRAADVSARAHAPARVPTVDRGTKEPSRRRCRLFETPGCNSEEPHRDTRSCDVKERPRASPSVGIGFDPVTCRTVVQRPCQVSVDRKRRFVCRHIGNDMPTRIVLAPSVAELSLDTPLQPRSAHGCR